MKQLEYALSVKTIIIIENFSLTALRNVNALRSLNFPDTRRSTLEKTCLFVPKWKIRVSSASYNPQSNHNCSAVVKRSNINK